MTTKILLTMPQPGETITEGQIVKWIATEGDVIKEQQAIVELETEKAVFEYESPYEGKLVEITAAEGETVAVGNPIAVFEVDDSRASTYFMLGIGKKVEVAEEKDRSAGTKKVEAGVRTMPIKLSPLIRKLMQEHHLSFEELKGISGTGPGGRMTKENILSYLKNKGERPPAERMAPMDGVISLSPVRLRTAERMAQSKREIPHAHASVDVDMSGILQKRTADKGMSLIALMFPVLKQAILDNPLVNASFPVTKEGKSIIVHRMINLGIATGTDTGLFIPVIRGVERMDQQAFADSLGPVMDRAKKNKLRVDDLSVPTFTFNNYGYYGTTRGVQVILPPQSATLGMGVIQKKPWVYQDKIEIRFVADVTLAFDHRVLDGRDASLFLGQLKKGWEEI